MFVVSKKNDIGDLLDTLSLAQIRVGYNGSKSKTLVRATLLVRFDLLANKVKALGKGVTNRKEDQFASMTDRGGRETENVIDPQEWTETSEQRH